MYKGTVYKCDSCGVETTVNGGLTKEWFQLRLERGSSAFSSDESDSGCILEGDYCCKACIEEGLELAKQRLLKDFNKNDF